MPDIRHAMEPEEMMAYLDGELPAARAAEAVTHLEHCAECQKLAADWRRVAQEMTAWQVEPPRAMTAPGRIVERPTSILFRRLFRVPVYALAPSALCLAVGFIWITTATKTARRGVVFDQEGGFVRTTPRSEASDGQLRVDSARDAGQQGAAAGNKSLSRFLPPAAIAAVAVEAAPAGPMIERTAALNLTTRDFDQLRGRIEAILARRHGYLAELTFSAPQASGRSLNASLRIPAVELDAALAELRQLGRVETESQKAEDVTRQYADLVARLTNARNTEQRLTQLQAQRTGKLSDVLEVEREIGRVRGEIEQMEAERRTTANQVAFAGVQLNVSEDYKAQLQLSPDSTLTRLRNAAVEGYKNLAEGLVGAALVLITYGPSVLIWGALAFFVGRWAWRRSKSPLS